jgi:hypothetical protein
LKERMTKSSVDGAMVSVAVGVDVSVTFMVKVAGRDGKGMGGWLGYRYDELPLVQPGTGQGLLDPGARHGRRRGGEGRRRSRKQAGGGWKRADTLEWPGMHQGSLRWLLTRRPLLIHGLRVVP